MGVKVIVEFDDGLGHRRRVRAAVSHEECTLKDIKAAVASEVLTDKIAVQTTGLQHNYELRNNAELQEFLQGVDSSLEAIVVEVKTLRSNPTKLRSIIERSQRFGKLPKSSAGGSPSIAVRRAAAAAAAAAVAEHKRRATRSSGNVEGVESQPWKILTEDHGPRKRKDKSSDDPRKYSDTGNGDASSDDKSDEDDEDNDEEDDEDDELEDLGSLGSLRPLVPKDRSRLTLSFLEDQLSSYRISWGSWKVEQSNKTIEDLFEELRNNASDLYADNHGVIRVVRLVRVKIVQPESKYILVNALKMVDLRRKHNDVHSLPAYKCKRNESPYHAALRNVQQELGFALWGPVSGIEAAHGTVITTLTNELAPRDPHARRRNILHGGTTILEKVRPTGFERPTHEFRESKSFPGLRTAYYINTLVLEMLSPRAPKQGSFTAVDQQHLDVIRLWQWMHPEHVQSKILREEPHANMRQNTLGHLTVEGSNRPGGAGAMGADDGDETEKAHLGIVASKAGLLARKAALYRQNLALMDGPPASSLLSRIAEFRFRVVQPSKRERHEKVEQENLLLHYSLPEDPREITVNLLNNWLERYGVDTSRWGTGQAKTVQQLVDELHKGETTLGLTSPGEAPTGGGIAPLATSSAGASMPPRSVPSQRFKNAGATAAAAGAATAAAALSGARQRLLSFRSSARFASKSALRVIRVAKVELIHERNPDLMLVETHQKLADSRLRVRFKTLAEKFKPGETPRDAALRGIREEIFDPDIYTVNENGDREVRKRPSIAELSKRVRILSIHAPLVEVSPSPSYPGLETRYILHLFRCMVPFLPDEPFCTDEPSYRNGGLSMVTHYWRWETRPTITAMTTSLINQVCFYFRLVPPAERDDKVLTDWLYEAAKTNQVNVIKLLCAVDEEGVVDPWEDEEAPAADDVEDADQEGGSSGEAPQSSASQLSTERVPRVKLDPSILRDKAGRSPLRIATLHGAGDAVEALIRIQLSNAQKKAQELLKTPREDQLHEMDVFAVNQPEKCAVDGEPCTLIYYAAIANRVSLVKHLLGSKSVAVNSVCLHSCISCGAVEALAVLLPRLRYDPSAQGSSRRRVLFGVEMDSSVDLNNPEVRARLSADLPKADNFSYFKSLLDHIERELNALSGAGNKLIWKTNADSDGQVSMAPALRALEVVLQYCNPTAYYYRSFLHIYLHKVIELDDRPEEEAILREFIDRSRFPLHIALMSAHVLRSVFGLEKRFWDSYQSHADNFQNLVCNILDCCEDQAEAEELLRERADIPSWRRENGTLVTRPLAHRHKSTCAYLAVKYRLKRVVAHKFFTTQNDAIWFNDANDSLYTRGLGSLANLSASFFPLFKQGKTSEVPVRTGGPTAQRFDVDRKTRNESLVAFLLRVPGLKTSIQASYRACVSLVLLVLLVLMTPVLWLLPFSRSLRIIVDIPRTEFACCYFKWSVWSMSYVLYLLAFAYLATRNAQGEQEALSTSELILIIFFLGNVVGIVEQIAAIGVGPFLQHSVNIVDVGASIVLAAAFCMDRTTEAYDILMSIGAILSTFRLFHLFSASKELGPLWITMQYVVWDVIRFLALLAVVLVAFILAFVFLLGGQGVEGFETAGAAFSSLVWSVFEAFTTYDPNQGVRTRLYQVFLFGFLLIAAVLLTNLLIAMMTRRFEQVAQTARVQWLYALAQLIEKYSLMPIAPSPINLLSFLPNLVFRVLYGKQSLYDPYIPEFKRGHSIAVVPIITSEDPLSNVNKRELEQALNFRCTRRAVMTRHIRKSKLRDAKHREVQDALARIGQTLDQVLVLQHKDMAVRSARIFS
ncbi:Short transient receptor potential channel 3 [Hondaea fermentalgiana]|uniref:Short transient receptor potential channel 3 n=1 Tax=Hondaea fermentalgiana TaxID=2315210 RepID=A0A2R5GE87_9STRA|nr:Short transient receptor potential channel 3 [Hondaea fermentalgiana]|eukprot:GBG29226.1 Short transient receptor potential channel 3 [Hondaea fermentalgiana]